MIRRKLIPRDAPSSPYLPLSPSRSEEQEGGRERMDEEKNCDELDMWRSVGSIGTEELEYRRRKGCQDGYRNWVNDCLCVNMRERKCEKRERTGM